MAYTKCETEQRMFFYQAVSVTTFVYLLATWMVGQIPGDGPIGSQTAVGLYSAPADNLSHLQLSGLHFIPRSFLPLPEPQPHSRAKTAHEPEELQS